MKHYLFSRLVVSTAFIVLLFLVSLNAFASGKAAEAEFATPPQLYYLSPKTQDGSFDTLSLDLSQTVKPGKHRKFVNVQFSVYNSKGAVVYMQSTELQKTTQAPNIIYDGTNNRGELLLDGVYVFTVSTIDDKNNRSTSNPFMLIVDNTPPDIQQVRLTTGNVIVPAGENRESQGIRLSIDGSPEVAWRVYAVSASTMSNKNSSSVTFSAESADATLILSQESEEPAAPPQLWEWSGATSGDTIITGGSYSLRVEAQDSAGNTAHLLLDTPVVVSQQGSFQLSADETAISPNGDGTKDTLPLIINGDDELLNSFVSGELAVFSLKNNNDTQSLQKVGFIPIADMNAPMFEGIDTNGIAFPDGKYEISLYANTEDDAIYITNTIPVTIDITPPEIAFTLQTAPTPTPSSKPFYFGGEQRNQLKGSIAVVDENTTSGDTTVTVHIAPESGTPITQTIPAPRQALPFAVSVNDSIGDTPLTDSTYTVTVFASDAAGNTAVFPPVKVIRDTEEKAVNLTTSSQSVSARLAPIALTADYSQTGLQESHLTITASDGTVVRTERVPYYVPSYEWDARDNANTVVPDGTYSIQFNAVYYNGETASHTLENITVDSTPPEVHDFASNTNVFVPSQNESSNTQFVVNQSGAEEGVKWTAEIRNVLDDVVISKQYNTLEQFSWDGTDERGNVVPDGDYLYILSATDDAGNETRRTAPFIVDTGLYEGGKILTVEDSMPIVYFSAFSDDIFSFKNDDREQLYKNLLAVRSVARLIKSNDAYKVTIIGHAAHLLTGERAKTEQTEVLIPLSRSRAESIRHAFAILGIDESRITVKAAGGSNPVVENPDGDTIWRNRRVVFEVQ